MWLERWARDAGGYLRLRGEKLQLTVVERIRKSLIYNYRRSLDRKSQKYCHENMQLLDNRMDG